MWRLLRRRRTEGGARADRQRIGVHEVIPQFVAREDPPSPVHLQHPLVSVVVLALLAVLAGAGGPTAIARWALLKHALLVQVPGLPHGVPRKHVCRPVLMAWKPAAFQACFPSGLRSLRTAAAAEAAADRPVLPGDGTSLRRSHDRREGLGALHLVSVWASASGLSLGQVACAERSNEVTAIPALLKLVDLTGAIVTLDATGTHKAIAEQIVAGQADSVRALKGDHETVQRAVIAHIDEQLGGDLTGAQEQVTTETKHGGVEARTYLQLPAPGGLPGARPWRGLRAIGLVTSCPLRDGKEAIEVRYSLSSPEGDVKPFARAVRGHGGIENGCHWALDRTSREDESRVRERDLRENSAWRNRFALSLRKQHPDRQSRVMKRRSCGWSDTFLMEVVTGSTC